LKTGMQLIEATPRPQSGGTPPKQPKQADPATFAGLLERQFPGAKKVGKEHRALAATSQEVAGEGVDIGYVPISDLLSILASGQEKTKKVSGQNTSKKDLSLSPILFNGIDKESRKIQRLGKHITQRKEMVPGKTAGLTGKKPGLSMAGPQGVILRENELTISLTQEKISTPVSAVKGEDNQKFAEAGDRVKLNKVHLQNEVDQRAYHGQRPVIAAENTLISKIENAIAQGTAKEAGTEQGNPGYMSLRKGVTQNQGEKTADINSKEPLVEEKRLPWSARLSNTALEPKDSNDFRTIKVQPPKDPVSRQKLEQPVQQLLNISKEAVSPETGVNATAKILPELPIGRISEQIIQKLKVNLGNNFSTMEISLKPEYIGKVKIKLVLREGMVSIKLMADSSDTASVLNSSLQQIKDNLEQQGIRIQNMGVSVAGQEEHREGSNYRDETRQSRISGLGGLRGDNQVLPGENLNYNFDQGLNLLA
jgi:flagellar hook-length control protein FliK